MFSFLVMALKLNQKAHVKTKGDIFPVWDRYFDRLKSLECDTQKMNDSFYLVFSTVLLKKCPGQSILSV